MSETHLILPVAAAETLVGSHRARLDPNARLGVPAHITVLGPFIEGDRLGREELDALAELFAATPAIRFSFARVKRFEHAVYLEPLPAGPFVALTEAIWRRWPQHPPYAGAHREIVPHLTVAVGEVDFEQLRAALEPQLPLAAEAREAWLMAQRDDRRWDVVERFGLGGAAVGSS